jgi:hypothetical protein
LAVAKKAGLGAVSDVQAEDVLGDAATLRSLFFPTRTPSKVPSPAASATTEAEAEAGVEAETLPLFVLKWQPPLVPGLTTKFKIFEPR